MSSIFLGFLAAVRLWTELFPAEKHRLMQLVVERITLWDYRLQIEIKNNGITSLVQELKAAGAGMERK